MTKLFNLYDADQTGFLKLSDFERLGRNLAELRGWKPGSLCHEHLLIQFMYHWMRIRGEIKRKTDRKFDATVTLAEWLQYHERALADPDYRRHIDFLSRQLCEVLEVDETGCFDRQQWQTLWQVYGIAAIDTEAALVAIDRSGGLNQEAVMSLLEEFFYSSDLNAPGNYIIFGPI